MLDSMNNTTFWISLAQHVFCPIFKQHFQCEGLAIADNCNILKKVLPNIQSNYIILYPTFPVKMGLQQLYIKKMVMIKLILAIPHAIIGSERENNCEMEKMEHFLIQLLRKDTGVCDSCQILSMEIEFNKSLFHPCSRS